MESQCREVNTPQTADQEDVEDIAEDVVAVEDIIVGVTTAIDELEGHLKVPVKKKAIKMTIMTNLKPKKNQEDHTAMAVEEVVAEEEVVFVAEAATVEGQEVKALVTRTGIPLKMKGVE